MAPKQNPRSKPQVSEDDLKLWKSYIKGIKPLTSSTKRSKSPPEALQGKKQLIPTTLPAALTLDPLKNSLTIPPPPPHKAPPSLEYNSRRRLKRPDKFDARLDLHGMTQDQAYQALHHFILQSITRGARNVLIITGKGVRLSPENPEAGVLRRRLPEWLNAAVFKPFITHFAQAHPHDGGTGAFQVRLKKDK